MRFLLLLVPMALAACAGPETLPTANPSAQDFSDVNVNAMARCVRANATDFEKQMLAEGGELAQSATRAIIQRPATGDCIVAAGVQLEPVG